MLGVANRLEEEEFNGSRVVGVPTLPYASILGEGVRYWMGNV